MLWKTVGLLAGSALLVFLGVSREHAPAEDEPHYTQDGQLKFPEQYREWVFLSSGFDMSYNTTSEARGSHAFDNVFVNPTAYKAFLSSGNWPDGTMLMLENRAAQGRGSINQSGHYQATAVSGLEIHVKDKARFSGNWAFFAFGDNKTARMIPTSADCYSCHEAHGIVDTTFVQFYPTLLPLAKSKGTLIRSARE